MSLQEELLTRLRKQGSFYVRKPSELSAARALDRRGLATLEDNGGSELRDGERWRLVTPLRWKRHSGLHTHRLRDNPLEERFAAKWRDVQEHHGRTLEYLMTPPGADQRFPFPLTVRDELVAATVVQWLGSPVGQGFLRDCGFVPASDEEG